MQTDFFLFQRDTAHNWCLSTGFLKFFAKINTEALILIFHEYFFPIKKFCFLLLLNLPQHLQISPKKFRTVESYQTESPILENSTATEIKQSVKLSVTADLTKDVLPTAEKAT